MWLPRGRPAPSNSQFRKGIEMDIAQVCRPKIWATEESKTRSVGSLEPPQPEQEPCDRKEIWALPRICSQDS